MAHEQTELHLPVSINTLVEIGQMQRELEELDNFLAQAAAREGGKSISLPKTSQAFEDFAKENGLQLLNKDDRERLETFLKTIREQAPVFHVSFAAEPSAIFLQKIVSWLRKEIHPMAILQVGLQPSIAAGCIVRTTNKYFDFSMRKHFYKKRELLIESMRQGMANGS